MRLLIPVFSPVMGTWGGLIRVLAVAEAALAAGHDVAFGASGYLEESLYGAEGCADLAHGSWADPPGGGCQDGGAGSVAALVVQYLVGEVGLGCAEPGTDLVHVHVVVADPRLGAE